MPFGFFVRLVLATGVLLGSSVPGTSENRPFGWRVDLLHTGETLPSLWSPPGGQIVLQPYAAPEWAITTRVAFEVDDEANCPEQVFAFHAGRLGIELSAPLAAGLRPRFNRVTAPQNGHLLIIQAPRCRILLRIGKATRSSGGDWRRATIWSQPEGPTAFPTPPVSNGMDPKEQEVAHETFGIERRAWEKSVSEWIGQRTKAVMGEMRQRDPDRAAAIDRKQNPPAEFKKDGYAHSFWFGDTPEPCFEANGYMAVGPSGVRITYRPRLQHVDPYAASQGSEPLVPLSASVTYSQAGDSGTIAFYDPTCRLEIGASEELKTTMGWVPAPVMRDN